MAERRMFAKSIVLSDAFLDMPMSARCLYFTLGMLADDDGFIGNPKSIMRQCGATDDDMKILLAKRFLLIFDSGVIVIKHWRMNNFLRSDRHINTTYIEEKSTLKIDEKGAYTEIGIPTDNQLTTNGSQVVYPGKDSIDKLSIGKDSIEEIVVDTPSSKKRFVKPTIDEIREYCKERGNNIDAESFYDFYESKGWKIGKEPMKDWKACVRTWERRDNSDGKKRVSFKGIPEEDHIIQDMDMSNVESELNAILGARGKSAYK